jgi:hypothetical protein
MSPMRTLRQHPDPDPMREIDLLLMEEIMLRRNFPKEARAIGALQTLCMLAVLAAATALFIHALGQRDATTSVVSVPADLGAAGQMPMSP